MERNQLVDVFAYQVMYQKIPQIMHQNFLNIQHTNIFMETEILLQVIYLVNKGREIVQTLGSSTIIKQNK